LLNEGDFVFADTSEDLEGVGIFSFFNSSTKIFAGYHTVIARLTEDHVSRYVAYMLDSAPFRYQIRKKITGVKVYSITQLLLKDSLGWFAPKEEQQKIADFLDWKTGQIDKLIEKKKQLIEKLDEQRTAVITQAVTKGLNPDAPMKDSGIPWLGEVPEHWQVRKLKFCFKSLNNRRVPLSSEERSNTPRNFPYYGASGIIDYVENYIFDEPLVLIGEDGANLLARSTPLAFVAEGKYWVNNHAHILKPILGPFIYWSNLLCIIEYTPWITGAAQPKLTKDNLGTVSLPCPPLNEQIEITEFISKNIDSVNPLVEKVNVIIAKLTEYRTSLITAATTGKIDLRDVEIPTID